MKGDKFIHTQASLRDRPLVKTVFRISYGWSLNTSLTVYNEDSNHIFLAHVANTLSLVLPEARTSTTAMLSH